MHVLNISGRLAQRSGGSRVRLSVLISAFQSLMPQLSAVRKHTFTSSPYGILEHDMMPVWPSCLVVVYICDRIMHASAVIVPYYFQYKAFSFLSFLSPLNNKKKISRRSLNQRDGMTIGTSCISLAAHALPSPGRVLN